jgi:RsiW-degrading membrane proteinase PrsW (M82 family)
VTAYLPSPPGAGPLPAPPKRLDWRRIGVLGVAVAGCLVCGIILLSIIGYHIGPVALVIGIAAAALPVPVLIACFMWLDRYEPEPSAYLVFCFLWGAFVAALVAYGGNTAIAALFGRIGLPRDLVAVLVAPIIEESMKALGPILLLLYTLRRHRSTFNGLVDAIVFFGLSAAGFAMSENILYLGGYGYALGADRAGVAGGLSSTIAVFIGRVPLAGFAHPLFTSMTALGVGVALRTTDPRVRRLAPLAGWLGAMLLHGSWNLMSTLASDTGHLEILLYGYFSVMMPIFFGMVWLSMWLRSAEGRRTQTALQPYVRAGWLSPPEVASLATVRRRRSAHAWAKRVAGQTGGAAMRGFQLAATQLALLRDRMERQAAAGAFDPYDAETERQLLGLMSAYRTGYVGRDPMAPAAQWDGERYHVRFPDGQVRTIDPPPQPVVPIPVPLAPAGFPPYPYR